jgi:hypothetical protein
LLITADSGGSNGSRVRLWKLELQKLADETGLEITICHLPPGTSKWTKIEHRLFSFISQNWRGKPLVSHQVIVNLIAATTTKTGLRVRAELDPGKYPKGVKVSDKEVAAIRLERDQFHGEWNFHVPSRCSIDFVTVSKFYSAGVARARIHCTKDRISDLVRLYVSSILATSGASFSHRITAMDAPRNRCRNARRRRTAFVDQNPEH